ncbi:hypothetical protein [Desulfoluna butyratoxydans]|nr:hypothetical protein [Desulfoluna butyratoxydans]
MTIISRATARHLMGGARRSGRSRKHEAAVMEALCRDPCLRECMDWVERWHLHRSPGALEVLTLLCEWFPGHHSWHRSLKEVLKGQAPFHRHGAPRVSCASDALQLLFSETFTTVEEGYALRRWVDRLLKKPPCRLHEFFSALGVHSTGGRRLVCVMSERQLEKMVKRLAPGPADRILDLVAELVSDLQGFRKVPGVQGRFWVLDDAHHQVARISTQGWNPWGREARVSCPDRSFFEADYRRDPLLLVWSAVLGDLAGEDRRWG